MMISRSGVNDWERGSITKWKHRMNLPSDNFFGTCKTLQIARENVLATNMSVEFLGYSSSDNINVKSVFISLSSPTWITQPLEFQAKDIGWTSTNLQTYAEGGLHAIAPLTLKDPGINFWMQYFNNLTIINFGSVNVLFILLGPNWPIYPNCHVCPICLNCSFCPNCP